MATTAEIPVIITPEANARIKELGMEREFESMIEHTKRTVPGLKAIEVSSTYDIPDAEGEFLAITACKDHPIEVDDPTRRTWDAWVVRSYSADVFRWFLFNVDYWGNRGR